MGELVGSMVLGVFFTLLFAAWLDSSKNAWRRRKPEPPRLISHDEVERDLDLVLPKKKPRVTRWL